MAEQVTVNRRNIKVHNYRCIFVNVSFETLRELSESAEDSFTVYDGEFLKNLVEDGLYDLIDSEDMKDIQDVIKLFDNNEIDMVTFGDVIEN